MNEIIGHADSSLIKYAPESPLSNFVADVVYDRGMQYAQLMSQAKILPENSFCLLNFGGLRAPINKGDVTIGNIFELMPFDNTIVIAELHPEQVSELLKYLYDADGQPLANGIMVLDNEDNKLWIRGKEYNFDDNLYVITSNYLADGGDKMDFFKKAVRKWDTGILIRDALIDYIKDVNYVDYIGDEDRIVIKN